MTGHGQTCRRLLGTLLLAGSMLVGAGTAGAIPVPEDDPFYAVPDGITAKANGTVLNSREIEASSFGLPLPATAWQVQYKTLDSTSRPSADVATILVPKAAWTGSGSRPLISYQTPEDAVAGKCSPSYSLRGGPTAGNETETLTIGLALSRGFAVIAPDYEGPESTFYAAPGQAHGVLDGVRAAQRFGPSGFTKRTPIALWGYSGGSVASTQAALWQPVYAPELKLSGIALGGLVADLQPTIEDFERLGLGGAIPIGLIGLQRAYPAIDVSQYLNAAGKAAVAAMQDGCVTDGVTKYPGLRTEDIEASPGAWFSPGLQALFHDNSPAGIAGVPTAPVYDYHAVLDELAPIANDRAMMHRLCDAGVTVQHVETAGTEHDTEAIVRASDALDFFAARFAGTPAVNTCDSIPAAPAAPAPVNVPTAAPKAHACRRITLRIRRLRHVHVTVDGRRVAVHRRGRTTRATIKPAGGTVTVRVTGRTKRGKRVVRVRRYHRC